MDRRLQIFKRQALIEQTVEAWAAYAHELERTVGIISNEVPKIGVSIGFKRPATALKYLTRIQKKLDPKARIVDDVTIECEFVGAVQGGGQAHPEYLFLERIDEKFASHEVKIRLLRSVVYRIGIDPEDYLDQDYLETNQRYL
jgi:hypothetical protein